jgi:hypothetical protein
MEDGILYAVMRIDDESDNHTYLCHDGTTFDWSDDAPSKNVVHINDEQFKILARWYWETSKGETPLGTWARRNNVSYNPWFLDAISYDIDNIVFCGCKLYFSPTLIHPLHVYSPEYNHVMDDDEINEWVQRLASNGQ